VAAAALAATTLAPSTRASIGSGYVDWYWGNPSPQGTPLGAIDFAGGRGYAAGDSTVLRTDDGGQTWTGLPSRVLNPIDRMQVVDADTVVVLGNCVLRRSDDGGATFRQIFYPVEYECDNPVEAVSFADKGTGYLLLQDGSVMRTGDGAQTFTRQTPVPGTPASANPSGDVPADIVFTAPDTGIAFVSPPNDAPSQAFRTTDGGVSWTPVDSIDPGSVRRAWMLDAQNGFAVGTNTLLATANGGRSWRSLPAGAGHDLAWIRCADRLACVMATAKGDVLLRTMDGGQTVAEITPSSQPVLAAAFASPTRVVAVGAAGTIVLSDDGGQNFAPVSHGVGGTYTSLRPGPSSTSAFALGEKSALAVTADGGATWAQLAVPTSNSIADVSFPTAATGYVLDAGGGLFRTANGGTSWQTLDTGSASPPRALLATAPDTVALVGPTGIRRSTAGGRFESVGGRKLANAALTGSAAGQGVMTAWGRGNVFVSTDAAATWRTLRLPKKARALEAQFPNARVGFVLSTAKRLFATKDGGRRWTELFAGTQEINGMSMATPQVGFLSLSRFQGKIGTDSRDAYVLRTDDGGTSWWPQDVARGVSTAVLATSTLQAYTLIAPANILFTTLGGDDGVRFGRIVLSPARAAKGRVTVRGRVTRSGGGEFIHVSRRDLNGTQWYHQVVRAGANGGGFTTAWKIKRSSVFVAQMLGGGNKPSRGRRGDASLPLVVRVGRR
jgi:photosystem II stability/assembly factor-like uncharacterized protein